MKWNTAIKQIENAIAENKKIEIDYHVKWNKSNCHIDNFDSIVLYEYNGETCKAVNTWFDQINEGSHIIDDVITG